MRAVAEISDFNTSGIIPCYSQESPDTSSDFVVSYEDYHKFLFRVKTVSCTATFDRPEFNITADYSYKHIGIAENPNAVDERYLQLYPGMVLYGAPLSGLFLYVNVGFVDSGLAPSLPVGRHRRLRPEATPHPVPRAATSSPASG